MVILTIILVVIKVFTFKRCRKTAIYSVTASNQVNSFVALSDAP